MAEIVKQYIRCLIADSEPPFEKPQMLYQLLWRCQAGDDVLHDLPNAAGALSRPEPPQLRDGCLPQGCNGLSVTPLFVDATPAVYILFSPTPAVHGTNFSIIPNGFEPCVAWEF